MATVTVRKEFSCRKSYNTWENVLRKTVFPTENAIIAAVKALDAGASQQVAEQFFAIRHGLAINPVGRNPDGQTIKGYPDITGRVPGEKKYLIEVTMDDWRKHIAGDMSKLP